MPKGNKKNNKTTTSIRTTRSEKEREKYWNEENQNRIEENEKKKDEIVAGRSSTGSIWTKHRNWVEQKKSKRSRVSLAFLCVPKKKKEKIVICRPVQKNKKKITKNRRRKITRNKFITFWKMSASVQQTITLIYACRLTRFDLCLAAHGSNQCGHSQCNSQNEMKRDERKYKKKENT